MNSADDGLPPSGPGLQKAFETLVSTLNQRGVRYAIIGGLAVIQHARVRTTDDIDALVAVPQVALPGLFEALQQRGFSVDVARNVRELRDDGLTVIRFEDVLVDLMRPVIPAYVHVLERAVSADILGQRVQVCSAEGLLVMKLIAMRAQDETDIREILAAYGAKLDLDFVRSEIAAALGADDPRLAKFEIWVADAPESG